MELRKSDVVLGLDSVSKEEAIKATGKKLVERGSVDESYIDSMLEREQKATTYMGLGIAIPHGTNEAKDTIKESGIVFLQYPDGVDFNGQKAYILIGIAGKGDEHLEILSNVAVKINDDLAEKLKTSKDEQDFLDAFGN